jgi:hypothetical protein
LPSRSTRAAAGSMPARSSRTRRCSSTRADGPANCPRSAPRSPFEPSCS